MEHDLMSWFYKRTSLLERERRALAASFPALTLQIREQGFPLVKDWSLARKAVTIEGIFPLDRDGETALGYDIVIVLPDNYPQGFPELFCRDPAISWDIDRHVSEENGTACLCVASERRRYFPQNADISVFLTKLVKPFLIGQDYYDLHKKWPWADRPHGAPGIIAAYQEMLRTHDLGFIRGMMKLLARQEPAKGHWPCPCGNGRILRDCHGELYKLLCSQVAPIDAQSDLGILDKNNENAA
jgi:hypothetical protein